MIAADYGSRPGGAALHHLLPDLYDELRRLAHRQRRRLSAGQTLATTALVHEAYLKLSGREASWNDETHLLSAAALAMRQILVDHARQRTSQKRGGGQVAEAFDESTSADSQALQVLALDLALRDLAAVDERLVRIVECRVFAGYSEEETAKALSVSLRTVQRDWARAKDWLRQTYMPRGAS